MVICKMRTRGGMKTGGMDMEMGVMDESGYEGYWLCMHGSMHASRRGIGKGVYQGMYGNLSKGGVEGKWV